MHWRCLNIWLITINKSWLTLFQQIHWCLWFCSWDGRQPAEGTRVNGGFFSTWKFCVKHSQPNIGSITLYIALFLIWSSFNNRKMFIISLKFNCVLFFRKTNVNVPWFSHRLENLRRKRVHFSSQGKKLGNFCTFSSQGKKLGNFDHTGKVREFCPKYWITANFSQIIFFHWFFLNFKCSC